jgi:DNA-binding transcriptional ArsR family regulator
MEKSSEPNDDLGGKADVVATIAALAHPRRLEVKRQLIDQEFSFGALAKEVSLTLPMLSQHLAKLRRQNLVETRREAQTVYYSCKSASVRRLLAHLESMLD